MGLAKSDPFLVKSDPGVFRVYVIRVHLGSHESGRLFMGNRRKIRRYRVCEMAYASSGTTIGVWECVYLGGGGGGRKIDQLPEFWNGLNWLRTEINRTDCVTSVTRC